MRTPHLRPTQKFSRFSLILTLAGGLGSLALIVPLTASAANVGCAYHLRPAYFPSTSQPLCRELIDRFLRAKEAGKEACLAAQDGGNIRETARRLIRYGSPVNPYDGCYDAVGQVPGGKGLQQSVQAVGRAALPLSYADQQLNSAQIGYGMIDLDFQKYYRSCPTIARRIENLIGNLSLELDENKSYSYFHRQAMAARSAGPGKGFPRESRSFAQGSDHVLLPSWIQKGEKPVAQFPKGDPSQPSPGSIKGGSDNPPWLKGIGGTSPVPVPTSPPSEKGDIAQVPHHGFVQQRDNPKGEFPPTTSSDGSIAQHPSCPNSECKSIPNLPIAQVPKPKRRVVKPKHVFEESNPASVNNGLLPEDDLPPSRKPAAHPKQGQQASRAPADTPNAPASASAGSRPVCDPKVSVRCARLQSEWDHAHPGQGTKTKTAATTDSALAGVTASNAAPEVAPAPPAKETVASAPAEASAPASADTTPSLVSPADGPATGNQKSGTTTEASSLDNYQAARKLLSQAIQEGPVLPEGSTPKVGSYNPSLVHDAWAKIALADRAINASRSPASAEEQARLARIAVEKAQDAEKAAAAAKKDLLTVTMASELSTKYNHARKDLQAATSALARAEAISKSLDPDPSKASNDNDLGLMDLTPQSVRIELSAARTALTSARKATPYSEDSFDAARLARIQAESTLKAVLAVRDSARAIAANRVPANTSEENAKKSWLYRWTDGVL